MWDALVAFGTIALACIAAAELWRRAKKSKATNPDKLAFKTPPSLLNDDDKSIADFAVTPAIYERFRKSLELLNQGNSSEKWDVATLAREIGMPSPKPLEDIFLGKSSPTFSIIQKFADHFGISPNWLTHGEGEFFLTDEIYQSMPCDYWEEITKTKPEYIFFARNNSPEGDGEATIILQKSQFRYITIFDCCHVSSHVGGTGQRQLLSFYELIKKILDSEIDMHIPCYGVELDEENYRKLAYGMVYPGAILSQRRYRSHWWDDLTDVYHERPFAEEYEKKYGEEFIRAQKIIRSQLD